MRQRDNHTIFVGAIRAIDHFAEQDAPPSTQNWAQNGWLSGTDPLASFSDAPSSKSFAYGSSVHATTVGADAPFRFTTIRDDEHITSLGDL